MKRPSAPDGIRFYWWLRALRKALRSPTAKQKDAYARYCHTLSAAGAIGAVTLVFSESTLTAFALFRAAAMLVLAVLLFLSGTAMFSEEK